ncbi:MAG: TerB family tellurite resistance protein [Bacteroidota bacterium]
MAHAIYDSWTEAHDLSLLYLTLMHGTEQEMGDFEVRMVAACLEARCPDLDPITARRILDYVLLIFISRTGQLMLETTIASLAKSMARPDRLAVVQDLVNIASSDGIVMPAEMQFISHVAHEWDLEHEVPF